MKKEISIKIDSELLDKIQVLGNQYLTFEEIIEGALRHIFECNTTDDLMEQRFD
jgi:hypothetical protein